MLVDLLEMKDQVEHTKVASADECSRKAWQECIIPEAVVMVTYAVVALLAEVVGAAEAGAKHIAMKETKQNKNADGSTKSHQ